ncbi:sensor histidine kinase [Tenacibaculum sp. TC6]|uniref:sensor histidine kinase n=1 Tax=Tenacibaculum sp. TC6 TaxID=3423223 RepID=UPI003D367E00
MSDYLWQTITPLIFFSFIWMLFRYIDKTKEVEKIQQERTELELKFLKSQINPHVLLNNLNTIYSFALDKPDETPDLILKLSDNLKHVLYESNSQKVDLLKELTFIDNYIELQKLRTEGIKHIHYQKNIEESNLQIAPLLLITIIENAFKHSSVNSDIDILIEVKNNALFCSCKNKFNPSKATNDNTIGLQNLKKRLAILYKDKYKLSISASEYFIVNLELNLM